MRTAEPALAVVLCLAGALLAGCRGGTPEGNPWAGVDVRRYDLALALDPETRRLQGRARLQVRLGDTLSVLPLAFGAMDVDSVRVGAARVVPVRRGDLLFVPLGTARQESVVVEVAYHGVPEAGVYAARYAGQQVVFTDGWPDRVKGWMPGVHVPSDPATLALSLTLPRGSEAVASGTVAGVDTLGGQVRYRWTLDVPAPTYTFAFAVADFSVTEAAAGSVPIRYHLLARDSARVGQLRRTPAALAYFSDLLGPYPFEAYACVQVPIPYGGMENAAAPFLRADLFAGPEVEGVQVHELAHQWFGNRVVLASWRDLWLSEGMATYLATLFYEHADGVGAARVRRADLAAPPGGRYPRVALVPEGSVSPEAMLSWTAYQKGAGVLHLLRLRMGDASFFSALRAAYAGFQGQALSTEAFQERLERHCACSLDALFDYWVYQARLPVLETRWEPDTRTLSWRLSGDAGTLAGVPVLLELRQGARVTYVALAEERVQLGGWGSGPPRVRPVGVPLRVE